MTSQHYERDPSDSVALIVFRRKPITRGNGVWSPDLQPSIRRYLPRTGSMLLRGFDVHDERAFREFVTAAGEFAVDPAESNSPRLRSCCSRFARRSLESPRTVVQSGPLWPLHGEYAFRNSFPLRLWFFQPLAPEPSAPFVIADCREVYRRLGARLRQHLERQQFAYVHEFSETGEQSWQTAFGTSNRTQVESWCAARDVSWEWHPLGLRLREQRTFFAEHPITGERVWFNPAHLRGPDTHLEYADTGAIEQTVLDEIRAALDSSATHMPLEPGDILVLDNLLTAHVDSSALACVLRTGWQSVPLRSR